MSVRTAVTLLMIQASGCLIPLVPIKEDTAIICDGTVLEHSVTMTPDPYDDCGFTTVEDEAGVGTGFILDVTAPNEIALPTSNTFGLSIGATSQCLEPDEASLDWRFDPVAAMYSADYDDSPCDSNCSAVEEADRKTVVAVVDLCDANEDFPGAYDTAPPSAPPEGTYTMSRSNNRFSGQFWYAVMERDDDKVCVLLRWDADAYAEPGYAAVVAVESNLGQGVKEYDLLGKAGIPFVNGSTSLTVTPSGNNRILEGSTGSGTLDSFYEVGTTWNFSPTSGPGAGWPPVALRWGKHTCDTLLSDPS